MLCALLFNRGRQGDARMAQTKRIALFLLLLVVVGLNLRPALSSLAPLLSRITQETGLSPLAIGALTTLPVLCLGIFAPLAPWLARRMGAEKALALALGILILGLSMRGFPALPLLYAGTDRKSTRLNSSHVRISYAVFCLKKKT